MLPNGKIDYAKLVRPEEEIDITPYFTREELGKMGHLETSRYKNMVMNYEVMIRMGKNQCLFDAFICSCNSEIGAGNYSHRRNRLKILDSAKRGIVLFCSEKNHGDGAADMLCFCSMHKACINQVFSRQGSIDEA